MKRLSKEINRIKALVIEDFETGNIDTYYNKNEFEELLNKYIKDEVTKIFEITPEIKNEITKVIVKSMSDKDNNIKLNIDGLEIFTKVFPTITDMDFDMSLEEDYEYLSDLINHPTEWMEEVLNVVEPRLKKIAKELIDNADKFNNLSKKEQNKLIDEIKSLESSKELEEIKANLNKLNENVGIN